MILEAIQLPTRVSKVGSLMSSTNVLGAKMEERRMDASDVQCTSMLLCHYSHYRLEVQQIDQTSTMRYYEFLPHPLDCPSVLCSIRCSRQSLEPDSGYVMGLLRGIKDR